MRLHRFFIEEKLAGKESVVILEKDLLHQWKNVFRLQAGDSLILLDGSGMEYISEILMLSKEKAEIKIVETKQNENVPKKEITLYAALIKNSNYEWILEKCTELGVAHFVPVVSERSEKKNLNIERARKIIKEASEQSGRGDLPDICEAVSLEEAIEKAGEELVVFDTEKENNKFDLEKIKSEKIGILIGPEGGWSDKEIEFFKSKNIAIYSLGKQILRAETAAIVASALFLTL